MISIKELLGLLNKNEQATLYYAYQHGISQFVEYTPGRFIGVHAERIPRLHIEQVRGQWSSGSIRETT